MSNWRENILKEFIPDLSKLTIVSDVDSLLSEEKLSVELRNKGFDIIEFNDPVDFRYAYESTYRAKWDRGEKTDLVVLLRYKDIDIENLPYDLYIKGRKLSFSLGEIFPNLSYPVIEKLDKSLLDSLFEAQNTFNPERLGDNATKDFILNHVFKISPSLINNDIDLFRMFLRIHYNQIEITDILLQRLINLLKKNNNLSNWPLAEIIFDNNKFFDFLQERWPIFLKNKKQLTEISEDRSGYNFNFTGPELLPFDHQDIRIYIDNLFVEGKLTPVHLDIETSNLPIWIKSGISSNDADVIKHQINRLFEIIEKSIPCSNCKYKNWISFSLKFGELFSLIYKNNSKKLLEKYNELDSKINNNFFDWLNSNYNGLMQLPPLSPVMLHHIPRYLAREHENEKNTKKKGIALLVLDGLSINQWFTVKKILEKQNENLIIRDSAVFAWIPTITSVSRQAIFSGKMPFYYANSINTTAQEEKLWKLFWESNGLKKNQVSYSNLPGNSDSVSRIESIIHPEITKIFGLVLGKVDKIMHGMELGAAGMHNQIEQWINLGILSDIINYFLNQNFEIWLTSDHGNIECKGQGRPTEGVVAETKGERARIYPDGLLRKNIHDKFNFSVEWQTNGLPENYFPLIAKNHDAFINKDQVTVGHGGISLEEVIVPFVKIERKQ